MRKKNWAGPFSARIAIRAFREPALQNLEAYRGLRAQSDASTPPIMSWPCPAARAPWTHEPATPLLAGGTAAAAGGSALRFAFLLPAVRIVGTSAADRGRGARRAPEPILVQQGARDLRVPGDALDE